MTLTCRRHLVKQLSYFRGFGNWPILPVRQSCRIVGRYWLNGISMRKTVARIQKEVYTQHFSESLCGIQLRSLAPRRKNTSTQEGRRDSTRSTP